MTRCRAETHLNNERAGLFRAGPFMDTITCEAGAPIQGY